MRKEFSFEDSKKKEEKPERVFVWPEKYRDHSLVDLKIEELKTKIAKSSFFLTILLERKKENITHDITISEQPQNKMITLKKKIGFLETLVKRKKWELKNNITPKLTSEKPKGEMELSNEKNL